MYVTNKIMAVFGYGSEWSLELNGMKQTNR
jgi:hypothetical protein